MPERFKTAQFEQSEPSATCRQSHRHFGNDLIAILFNQRMRLNQSALRDGVAALQEHGR